MLKTTRVRFAPSPTGFMHLGNIRVALLNYLFARQKNGTFVLRIEDTDASRNVNEAVLRIMKDLEWLGIGYDEGPEVGGKFGPYLQSERDHLYRNKLKELIGTGRVYRCFCKQDRLEEMRKRQAAAGKPPRYDRACLDYSQDKIDRKLDAGLKFIWRFKINEHQLLDIHDMGRKKITFDMKNFSDFAITRQDGSFTFMFANFVDDWLMKISHVIRGEDHLSNTAMQAAMYDAFAVKAPTFWHLPIICNERGEKLSKRDFGFSLQDLKSAGFLAQAICNYLAIIGGSFLDEVQSVESLISNFNFDDIRSHGSINYDVEKLRWLNHKWIEKIPLEDLVEQLQPFLHEAFPSGKYVDISKLTKLVAAIRPELKTLCDVGSVAKFYFQEPVFDKKLLEQKIGQDVCTSVLDLIKNNLSDLGEPETFLKNLKSQAKDSGVKIKDLFMTLRYLLTGDFHGMGVKDLFEVLEVDRVEKRFGVLK